MIDRNQNFINATLAIKIIIFEDNKILKDQMAIYEGKIQLPNLSAALNKQPVMSQIYQSWEILGGFGELFFATIDQFYQIEIVILASLNSFN